MLNLDEEDPKETLKGAVQAFLSELEQTEESEDDMKTLLPLWRDELLNRAREVGGSIHSRIKILMNVCEDYASNRGMIERVRQEVEEIRIQLDI
ncbi:MAG: hypothetical protein KDK76_01495 [Chlamydiia bacterium]|nr:hypothetical protein [Chlamydiia bacterium]